MAKKAAKQPINLSDFSSDELEQELERRRKPTPPHPHSATNVSLSDLNQLRALVVDNIQYLYKEGRQTKDIEHYCYEIAMEMFYGKEVWPFVNAILK